MVRKEKCRRLFGNRAREYLYCVYRIMIAAFGKAARLTAKGLEKAGRALELEPYVEHCESLCAD